MTVIDVEDPLFVELRPNPVYPPALVMVSAERHGVRYVLLGEDGDTIMFLGHTGQDSMLQAAQDECPFPEEDQPVHTDLKVTWARFLTACPDHPAGGGGDDCWWCQCGVSEREWQVDWAHADGRPDEHRDTPGYFPVVVFDLEPWR